MLCADAREYLLNDMMRIFDVSTEINGFWKGNPDAENRPLIR
jgi:hypothetical protein